VPVELSDLVGAGQAAVVTMELQRGVVGDLSSFPALADEVARVGVVAHTARLLAAARRAGVPVVHCTAGFRADRLGSPSNAPLMTAVLRRPEHLLEATGAVELIEELGAGPTDLVSHRRHGVSPFVGTTLDPTLRALGVSTVIGAGVSLNLGIIGLAVEAVDLGYHVVLATDAVAGIPSHYADDVLRHTLGLVATLATVDEIIAAIGP
jgi:nicotinamidase-related amidase